MIKGRKYDKRTKCQEIKNKIKERKHNENKNAKQIKC